MVLDECVDSTAPTRPSPRAAMERTHRWALRSLAARTQPGGQALFAIVQGGVHPDAAARVGGLPDRASLRRLRHRRARGRRHPRPARGHHRAIAAELLPGGSPALPDGRRHAARPAARDAARRRHVRLRVAHPPRLARAPPSPRPAGCASRAGAHRVRRGAPRRGLRLQHLPHLQPRLPAPPLQVQRAARPAAAVDPQPAPLPRRSCARRAPPSRPATTPPSPGASWPRSIATSTPTARKRPGRERRPRRPRGRPHPRRGAGDALPGQLARSCTRASARGSRPRRCT